MLKDGSTLIDAGDFLTTVLPLMINGKDGPSQGAGSVIAVADPLYFSDGFGIAEGDTVKLQNGETAKITGIEYGIRHNIIQLDRQKLIYTGYKNTVFITVAGTFISLLLTFMTAYPLSQGRLRGKTAILNFIFFTMLFDGGMIPTYIIVRGLKLTDTLWAMIIPSAISVFNLLIMTKFLRGIPISLIESAKIGGYNERIP